MRFSTLHLLALITGLTLSSCSFIRVQNNPIEFEPEFKTSSEQRQKAVATGKVCYACNGKGYSFLPKKGENARCSVCDGDGVL